ncbi:hypothetical protein J5Y09_17690 [Roseomonas sp. PWR1]|uniref:Uncharacterized protein n=1 Tax=Roseomonas nitratireducens TaxID=2820810 RepID=A0ABS4AWM3_9PROT|nr:hypothetical protein [Neoroseomonas nitratireducens]MBP0465765.1 hypothetical protein [Neoroseomonas nitratireducens]
MRIAIGLLAASALALPVAGLWPRAGHPVLLAMPAGMAAGAFGVEGWRIQRIIEAGPFPILLAMPENGASDPSRLAAAAGALLVLAARPMSGCAPAPRRT